MKKLTREQRRVVEGSTAVVKIQYFDGDGNPLARSSISALTLTLKDRRTAAVINSRSAVDVLDDNNGEVPADVGVNGITQSRPARLTFDAAHRLETGFAVYLSGIGGMTELNNRTVRVTKVSDTVVDLDDVDSTDFSAYTSGGSARLGLLIMTLQPADNPIVGLSITGALQTNPVELTFSTAHELNDGDEIYIENAGGMTELNNRRFVVTRSGWNTVTLDYENGEDHTAYTSGGKAVPNPGEVESHVARFDLTHSGGVLPTAVQIDVENLI